MTKEFWEVTSFTPLVKLPGRTLVRYEFGDGLVWTNWEYHN